jgi:hypothetical protein
VTRQICNPIGPKYTNGQFNTKTGQKEAFGPRKLKIFVTGIETIDIFSGIVILPIEIRQ